LDEAVTRLESLVAQQSTEAQKSNEELRKAIDSGLQQLTSDFARIRTEAETPAKGNLEQELEGLGKQCGLLQKAVMDIESRADSNVNDLRKNIVAVQGDLEKIYKDIDRMFSKLQNLDINETEIKQIFTHIQQFLTKLDG
jgi:uncharacterized protein YicC (UPF0701 family)